MKREEYIEQVYLSVCGGRPSQDVSIERLDISNFFDACLPATIEYEYQARKWATMKTGDRYLIDEEFLSNSTLTVQKDDCQFYADVPNKIQMLPDGQGIRNIFSLDFATRFVKVASRGEISGLDSVPGIFVWHELVGGVNRLHFSSDPKVAQVRVEYVRHAESYADEEEVVCPGSVAETTIRKMTEYFLPERSVPADEIINSTDEAHKQ